MSYRYWSDDEKLAMCGGGLFIALLVLFFTLCYPRMTPQQRTTFWEVTTEVAEAIGDDDD